MQASEYAGWLAAFGIRANHFTVAVNRLTSFANLAALNDFLEGAGLRLNGGDNKIQGSPAVLLEQSSTLAQPVTWQFADQVQAIPSCYYEFALRYIDPATGELYDGFVAKSADKIFESTDVRHHLA